MQNFGIWKNGDKQVSLIADSLDAGQFRLESNFPMWKIDEVGYGIKSNYMNPASARKMETVYDPDTGIALYDIPIEPEEFDRWELPFTKYRYYYPSNKTNGMKTTCTWLEGWARDKEAPLYSSVFSLGTKFKIFHDSKSDRLAYQKAHPPTGGWTAENPPTLFGCLNKECMTWWKTGPVEESGYTKTALGFRFFDSAPFSIVSYLVNQLPKKDPSPRAPSAVRMPIRFYDMVTNELYYFRGFLYNELYYNSRNNGGTGITVISDPVEVRRKIETHLTSETETTKNSYYWYIEGNYLGGDKVNLEYTTTTNIGPGQVDMNDVHSYTEIIDSIVKGNNLDTKFFDETRLILRLESLDTTTQVTTHTDYAIMHSAVVYTETYSTSTEPNTNFPLDDDDKLTEILDHGLVLVTDDVSYKPAFIINDRLSVGFPVTLNYMQDSLRDVKISNYAFDGSTNKITFDVSLFHNYIDPTVTLRLMNHDLEVTGVDERYLTPPSQEYEFPGLKYGKDYNTSWHYLTGYRTASGDSMWDYFAMVNSAVKMYDDGIQQTSSYIDEIRLTYNQYGGGMGNSLPMTQDEYKFVTEKIFHCAVVADSIEDTLQVIGNKVLATERVAYAKYDADMYYEKLINNVAVTVVNDTYGYVTLHPYMYDVTKIFIKDQLGTSFNAKDCKLYINEVLPNGKSCEFVLNDEANDLVFTTPFTKNEKTGYYEMIIYIAAKNTTGLGFNDSICNLAISLPEGTTSRWNLKPSNTDGETAYWNLGFRTFLPPYMVQGQPVKKVKSYYNDQVLSGCEGCLDNYDERVNFPGTPYANNTFGWSESYLFTNGDPLYVVTASGFIPEQLSTLQFTEVKSEMRDEITTMKTPLTFTETAPTAMTELVALTSGANEFTNTPGTDVKAKFNIWTYEQNLSAANINSFAKNAVTIQGKVEYDLVSPESSVGKHTITYK